VGLCLLRGAGGVEIARGASGSAPDVADKVQRRLVECVFISALSVYTKHTAGLRAVGHVCV
jgi:hypothetical protein